MFRIKNTTKEMVQPVARINGDWFDGLSVGETLEISDPFVVRAFEKRGCEVVDVEAEEAKAADKKVNRKTNKPKKKIK